MANPAPNEFQVIGDILLVIDVLENGYKISIKKNAEIVFSTIHKSEPWFSVKIQTDIASQAFDKLPLDGRPDKEHFKSLIHEIFNTISARLESDNTFRQDLNNPTVRAIIEATAKVDIYPGGTTEYLISLKNGEQMQFTPEEIIGTGRALEIKWLNANPKNPLRVKSREWQEIVTCWASIGEVHEKEEASDLDSIIESLQEHLSALPVGLKRDALSSTQQGWWEEKGENSIVWIPGTVIAQFLQENRADRNITSAQLAKELNRREHLWGVSKTLRIDNSKTGAVVSRKCWQFKPEFGGWTRETCMDPNKHPGR